MEWIPVSKPPKKDGRYFVVRENTVCGLKPQYSYGVAVFATDLYMIDERSFSHYRGKKEHGFYSYSNECGFFEETNIAAWCPIPEFL